MTDTDRIRTTKRLTLTQAHAHALLRVMGEFQAQYEGPTEEIDKLHQQLGDAFSIARWQRENAEIDLEPFQVIDLLKAIVMMLEDLAWTEEDTQALETASRQLSEMAFAPGLVAVGTRGPHAQFNRLELRVTEVPVGS